ncbi:class I SAM-dependent methyltransferase [Cumulibacter soli]|uniref:class I SAM-dependent methyltransferase n=1 Tax=Cumulibacter soli TaxID=2546344 RepID=UPI001067D397|nr:class I SAM-dependent methyltransferase [Cumulibacter soli]
MTTLPPRFDPADSHRARGVAESFGADAAAYHRARPDYPPALADRIIAASPGRDVLDVGIGTGISAQSFQAAGCRALGVEVDARMAEFARSQGFDVEVAKFEDWDSAGRTFDIVIAGQTWHWIDPVAGPTKAARVLRPSGRLAAFWNTFQFPSALAETLPAVYARVLGDTPFSRGMFVGPDAYAPIFDKTADGIRQADGFGDPERWRTDWQRHYTRDEWLNVVPTAGGINQLPQGKLEELLAGIGTAIDTVGGSFTMTYTAVTVTAARADAP